MTRTLSGPLLILALLICRRAHASWSEQQTTRKLAHPTTRPVEFLSTGRAWGNDLQQPLEVKPECHLPGPVPRTFRCLRRSKRAEGGRAAYIRCRRSEVCMVQHIGECSFKAKAPVFPDWDHLCQTRVHCHSARTFKAANSCITNQSCAQRWGCERVDVEERGIRAVSRYWISDAIRTNYRYTSRGGVSIGLIIAHAHSWSQIRTRFQQRDGVQIPAPEDTVYRGRRTGPPTALAEWQLIRSG